MATNPYAAGGANPYMQRGGMYPQQQNPYSAGAINPYLGQQANAIAQQANQNLQYNVLPGINSGAVAAGGYGGSRQGIAQGLAVGMNQQGIANATANLYGQAFDQAQNRAMNYDVAQMNNATTQRGQDLTNSLGYAGLGTNVQIAGMNNATTARGQDLNYGLGMMQNATTARGQDMNYGLGMAQNATTQRGQDINRDLGYAGLANTRDIAQMNDATSRYGINTNAATTTRGQDLNYGLGMQQNATTQRGQDLNYGASMANVDLGYAGLGNQLNIANLNNATQRYGYDSSAASSRYASDNSLAGTRYASDNSLAGTRYASDNSLAGTKYSSDSSAAASKYASDNSVAASKYASDNSLAGSRYATDASANTAAAANATTLELGQGNLALGNRNADINAARTGSEMFTNAINSGVNWANALTASGEAELMDPNGNAINPYLAVLNGINPYTYTGTATEPGQGGGWAGALGGAATGAQLYNLLFGKP